MFITDCQVHVWEANTPERPWPTPLAKSHKNRASFTKEDLLAEMDAAGVSRAILVPPSWQGDSNDTVIAAARAHPDRFAVMGRIDTDDASNTEVVENLKERTGMKGLRLTYATGEAFSTPQNEWLWAAAEKGDVPIAIAARSEMLPEVKAVAARYPGIKFAIDHFAVVRGKMDDAAFADIPMLLDLADVSNVSVKVSALPCYSTEEYPYRGLHKYVRQVYDKFGPERMFWGADVTRSPCTYSQTIAVFTEEMDWLSEGDKELIMGKAVCNWLGWPLP